MTCRAPAALAPGVHQDLVCDYGLGRYGARSRYAPASIGRSPRRADGRAGR